MSQGQKTKCQSLIRIIITKKYFESANRADSSDDGQTNTEMVDN